MLRAKRRRASKYNTKGKQIFSTLNTNVKYKRQLNVQNGEIKTDCSYNPVPCNCSITTINNPEKTIGCKTNTQRNPLSGYRKDNILSSITDCSKIPTNTVYTDNYARNKPGQNGTGCSLVVEGSGCVYDLSSCIQYKQYNPTVQNKHGYINDAYNYSTKQYLSRRNDTYTKRAFNFLSNKNVNDNKFSIKDSWDPSDNPVPYKFANILPPIGKWHYIGLNGVYILNKKWILSNLNYDNSGLPYSPNNWVWGLIVDNTYDPPISQISLNDPSNTYNILPWTINNQNWIIEPSGNITTPALNFFRDNVILSGVSGQFISIDYKTKCYKDPVYNQDLFNRWRDKNKNNGFAVYKPNNRGFSQQGAVSGGARLNRLKYQTQMKAQICCIQTPNTIENHRHNNIINGAYPATLYYNGTPVHKEIISNVKTANCKRTQSGIAQRCHIKSNFCI